ncbi:2OG-Fe(II) oxygenase [Acidisoma sp. C75]
MTRPDLPACDTAPTEAFCTATARDLLGTESPRRQRASASGIAQQGAALPDAAATATHVLEAIRRAAPQAHPYRHWLPHGLLPEALVDALLALPLAPPRIGEGFGRRETHNAARLFFGTAQQGAFPVCQLLADALATEAFVQGLADHTGAVLSGTSLRIEYCLDRDGFWLEPHTDIGAKHLTLLIYLADPPPGEDWGTDLYEGPGRHVGTAPARRNAGLLFVPAADTWHGFIPRRITGVRRSLIVNYVSSAWRARHELAQPDQPVGRAGGGGPRL